MPEGSPALSDSPASGSTASGGIVSPIGDFDITIIAAKVID